MYYYKQLIWSNNVLELPEVSLGNTIVSQKDFNILITDVFKVLSFFTEYLQIEKPKLSMIYQCASDGEHVYKSEDKVNGVYFPVSNSIWLNLEGYNPPKTLIHELRHAWQAKMHGGSFMPSETSERDAEEFAVWSSELLIDIDYKPENNV